jgi:hypothetical protein
VQNCEGFNKFWDFLQWKTPWTESMGRWTGRRIQVHGGPRAAWTLGRQCITDAQHTECSRADRVHGLIDRAAHSGPRWTAGGVDTRVAVHRWHAAHRVQHGSKAHFRGSERKRAREWSGEVRGALGGGARLL